MIQFRCICGESLDVPAEMAGESLQCPACMRLVDVPTLEGLADFEGDGTMKMGDAHERASDLADKFRAFGRADDLRPTVEEFMLAGDAPDSVRRERTVPKYDPVTGELILPVGIVEPDRPPAPPIDPNAAVLGYARTVPQAGTRDAGTATWWKVPFRLLTGTNPIAMGVVYVLHLFIYLMLAMPGFNLLWLPIALFSLLTIIAHYCNTMEDFGPANMERVPVLLRSGSFSEDVLRPLYFAGISGLLAFLPLIVTSMATGKHFYRDHPGVLYALAAVGALLFPVLAFTTVCGGTLHNLWPHRVWSVVRAAPAKLVLGMAAFWLGMSAYSVAGSLVEVGNPAAFFEPLLTWKQALQKLLVIGITFLSAGVAVYLTHLAAAWLGLIYRDHHNDIDWVLQRHDRDYRTDTMAELMRGRGRPPVVTTVPPRHDGLDVARAKHVLPLTQSDG